MPINVLDQYINKFNLAQIWTMLWTSLAKELDPQPGIELSPLAVEVRSLNCWTTREDPVHLFSWPCSVFSIFE